MFIQFHHIRGSVEYSFPTLLHTSFYLRFKTNFFTQAIMLTCSFIATTGHLSCAIAHTAKKSGYIINILIQLFNT